MGAARMLGFAVPGAEVAVRADRDDVLGWLGEVLAPGFSCGPAGADGPCVTVHTDGRPGSGSAATTLTPCFALDREVVSHPSIPTDDSVELFDAKFHARYVISDRGVDVHPDGPEAMVRVASLRVVRELAIALALADGTRVQLHASAFEVGGRVVVLAGPKEAGKTTLLAHVCSSTGAAMVTNDRLLVSPAWRATPVPTIVSVRAGTMAELPGLFGATPDVERPAHLTLAEADAAAAAHGTVASPRRLKLSPPQLARALGVPLSAGGAVSVIALVGRDPDAAPFSLRPLPPDRARARLADVQYGAGLPWTPTIFEERFAPDRRPPSADAAVLDGIAADVAVHEVLVGPSFLRSTGAADDLVAALLSSG